jgi:hypothetical protein
MVDHANSYDTYDSLFCVGPHHQTMQRTPEVIDKLKTKYGDRDHFEYQDRMVESDSLFRSDILISDWSAMAIEYALGLEKPVLFIDFHAVSVTLTGRHWVLSPRRLHSGILPV